MAPVLLTQATIYPEGRIQSILMKGIPPQQKIIKLPTNQLSGESDDIPAIIGTRMASNNKLNVGDYITVRWRDANGTAQGDQAFHSITIIDDDNVVIAKSYIGPAFLSPYGDADFDQDGDVDGVDLATFTQGSSLSLEDFSVKFGSSSH